MKKQASMKNYKPILNKLESEIEEIEEKIEEENVKNKTKRKQL